MAYPKVPDYNAIANALELYSQLKHEYGAKGISPILKDAEKCMKDALKRVKALPIDRALAKKEPNNLAGIQALRPKGPRRMWDGFDKAEYQKRLEGALIGRFAGCTLGAPVEFWSISDMKELADEIGDDFPPTDYWSRARWPNRLRYNMSPRSAYTRKGMDGVPVDDDLAYTLLGLLILEDHGPDFTVEDVGKAWVKYLPAACTAEKVALENLKKGVPAERAGARNNPYCEWIGADIRSDPWGYLAPGWPERAAEMAYRDAFISHRRQGIYGEMYFSAAISAAFAVDDPVEALELGLTEIPKQSAMTKAVKWALKVGPGIKDYQQARDTMETKFKGMHRVHTINNACLTIWGVMLGGKNLTKVIGETVAMGMDNDCTAATAGSIVGAIVGEKGIAKKWYRNFNNTVHSYLTGRRKFSVTGLLRRFTKQAKRVFGE